MEALNIEKTEDTPAVILDKGANKFEISGRSLPEDAASFFQPILEWIENYAGDANEKTPFEFKLEYFNTASSKLVLDMLLALEDIPGCTIIWYSDEDDEDMQEAGEEFSELVEIPFEFRGF